VQPFFVPLTLRCGLDSLEYTAAKKVAPRGIVSWRNGSTVTSSASRRYDICSKRRAVHNKHTEAARECSQFEAGTPNVAIAGDFSSPPCRPAEVASFARLSTARRVSFTIVAHPITKPATPTVPDDNPKRAMTMNGACKAEVVRTAPKSEISAAAAKEPRDV